MAVETTVISASFTGTGVSSTYSPGFYANSSDQVVVTVDGVLQTIGDDYVVNNVGLSVGCDIVANFTLGADIYIERVTPITQLVDTQNNETILEDVLDAEFDKLTMISQEIDGKVARAVLFPKGEAGYTFPAAAARASRVLGFDVLGAVSMLAVTEATITDAALITFLQSGFGAVDRSVQDKLRETTSVLDFGAVADDATDNATAIQNALDSGAKIVRVPGGGTFYCATGLAVPAGVKLKGPGTLRFPIDINGVTLGDGAKLCDLTIDGTAVDDVAGDSGVLLGDDCYLEDVIVRNFGFQGFASVTGGSSRNVLIGCRAYNVGHRGLNFSEGSSHNRVTNFQARNCKKAGVLVGYLSNYNIFDDVFIDGVFSTSGGAGLWVHMNSNYNQFSNFQIGPQDGSGTTAPHVLLGAASQYNSFTGFNLYGVGTRGVYVWNLNTDSPGLGTSDAPVVGNVFKGFKVFGTNAANSNALSFKSDDGEVINENTFVDWEITGFEDGVEDLDSLTNGLRFKDFRFGTITGRKMRVGTTVDNFRASRRRDCEGLTAVGSLAIATAEYGAQPAVPATAVPVTQCYPFPVNIYVKGLPAGSNILIDGVNINSAAPNDGNGVHTVYPGQTIALSYASGTPTWRWWGLDW